MTRFAIILIAVTMTAVGVQAAGLEKLATINDRSSHRASSYDRSGGNIDNVTSFAPGETHVVLDVDGPGKITHFWMTLARFPGHETLIRDLVIRMYWENSEVPSVEVPVGDFFAMGHGKYYPVKSMPVSVGLHPVAMNCYWPMPFHKHARIEFYNNGLRSIRRIYYNVDYELGEIEPDQGLFHAMYVRDKNLRTQEHGPNPTGKDNFVMLDIKGKGHYVGCVLSVFAEYGHWWGEGDEMIFIDGDDKPTIHGTGSEDYFCNAWGYHKPFSYPYYGAPYYVVREDGGRTITVYRWHVPDPVRFDKSIRVTIERLFDEHVANDYTCVTYWYQQNPIAERPALPEGKANHPQIWNEPEPIKPEPQPVRFDLYGPQLEEQLRERGIQARAMTANLDEGYSRGGWLKIDTGGKPVELVIEVPKEKRYRVGVKPVNHLINDEIKIGYKGQAARSFPKQDLGQEGFFMLDLGPVQSQDKKITLVVGGNEVIGIDLIKVEQVLEEEPEIPGQ